MAFRAILYTVGHRESYEQYFAEQGRPEKAGREDRENYKGGSVYITFEEAKRACPDGYAPYGLQTGLENTYLNGSSRHLINSAPLLKLDEHGIAV
jgi:hypothetical protein